MTTRTLTLTAVLVGIALHAGAQQVSPLRADLVIPDQQVLPGVPFDMWIHLRNTSDSAVTVGLLPTFTVRRASEAPVELASQPSFYPVLLRGAEFDGARPQRAVTVPAGGDITLTLPADAALRGGSPLFADPRFQGPGSYTLAIKLDAFPQDTTARDTAFFGPVRTSEATIERIQPTGTDLQVWRRMQEIANGKWANRGITTTVGSGQPVDEHQTWRIWSELLRDEPDSNYVPYALLFNEDVSVKYRDAVLGAIQRFPASPVIEYLDVHARDLTAAAAGFPNDPMAAAHERELQKVKNSTRPTTRTRAFGREDLPRPPCPPDHDCQ